MNRQFRIATLAALASLAWSAPAFADDTQAWLTGQVSVKLDPKWSVSEETVLRTSDAKSFYELESNLLLNFRAANGLVIGAGYTHDPSYDHGDFRTMEHRARQQVTIDIARFGKAKLSGRMRNEIRWRDGADGTAWRLRPYLKLSAPVGHGLELAVSHESFFDLNRTAFVGRTGWSRMRNAVTLAAPLGKHFKLEGGYLEQHGFVVGGPDTDDHVGTLTLSASF